MKRTRKISTVNLRLSSNLCTKSNHSASTNVLFTSLTAQATGFSPGNLPQKRPTTTTTAIIIQVFMFRYKCLNSTRKFTIVAEIVSLLKKIYKSGAPLRAVFNNYRDYNTSLHVSLRTLKFDKKIHYCCRDSFFVEKDIQK